MIFDGFTVTDVPTPAGGRVRVRTAGTGPAVVLLHGYPQTSAMWHLVAPDLARDHSVFLVDLRGYGDSIAPPGAEVAAFGKRAMAAEVVAVMDALGHDRFAVVGHDRGARCAYRLALDHPERVTALAVLDILPTAEVFARVDAAFARSAWHWFFLAQAGDLPERLIASDPDGFFLRGVDGIFAPEAVAAYRAAYTRPSVVHAMCQDYRAGATVDVAADEADRGVRTIGSPRWWGGPPAARWATWRTCWRSGGPGPLAPTATSWPVATIWRRSSPQRRSQRSASSCVDHGQEIDRRPFAHDQQWVGRASASRKCSRSRKVEPGRVGLMSMTTRAAICRAPGTPWEIADVELDDPGPNEVLIRFHAAGLCHSDDHIQKGSAQMRFPVVGGHEGAGVVEAVGDGVTRVGVGDHVVCSFIPACGECRYCSTGRQNLCDAGKNAATGEFPDGTFRFHLDGEDLGGLCVLGTFSQLAVVSEFSVIPIPQDVPFDVAALVACAVPTGWGSAVRAAGVRAGETVVIYGCGGVGSNAVQGARFAGAKNVVVVDPVEFKRDMAKVFGATHTFADPQAAHEFVVETTWGELADHAIITVGVLHDEVIANALAVVGKCGQVTVTAVGAGSIKAPAGVFIGYQRRVQGAIFGGCSPLHDVPRLLGLYRSGDLKLDELITRRYRLDEVNEGYQDMWDGKNIRGVIIHEH